MAVVERRLPPNLGLVAREDGLVPEGRAALDLVHPGIDIPEGARHHGDEALRIGAAPLDQEVVVGLHALEHELGIPDLEEGLGPEAAGVGVENLGMDAVVVHQGQTRLGVPGRGRTLVEGHAALGKRAVVAGRGHEAGAHARVLAAHDPDVPALDALEMGDGIAPFRRQPGGPGVGRLGDVGIGVDGAVPIEERDGHERSSSSRVGVTKMQVPFPRARRRGGRTAPLAAVLRWG
jgi:hypothetical protein